MPQDYDPTATLYIAATVGNRDGTVDPIGDGARTYLTRDEAIKSMKDDVELETVVYEMKPIAKSRRVMTFIDLESD